MCRKIYNLDPEHFFRIYIYIFFFDIFITNKELTEGLLGGQRLLGWQINIFFFQYIIKYWIQPINK